MVDSQVHSSVESLTSVSPQPIRSLLSVRVTL